MGTNPNPFATLPILGLNPPQGGKYVDVDFTYPYDTVAPIAVGLLLTGQTVPLQNDADFILRAWHWTFFDAANTGAFRVRINDSRGYYFSSAMILSGNISNIPAEPTPFSPEIIFPRGGEIGLDIQNIDGALLTSVQICFRGVKRYRVAG